MQFQRLVLVPILGALFVMAVAGCGGSAKPTIDVTGQLKLDEITNMLKVLALDGKDPPAGLADLDAIEPLVPLAVQELRSGELIYIWKSKLSSDPAASSTVIAYEKKAPSEGGWVLTQDGVAKEMSAAEFSAAPKAK